MKERNSLRIYIAGPYTAASEAETNRNVVRAIDVGLCLWKKGHFPYIPHLTHFVELRAREKGISMTWEDYIDWDEEWLEFCDALLYLGDSKGANLELKYAEKTGKIIFYDVNDVPTVRTTRRRSS